MKDKWHRSHEWIQLLLDNPDMDPEEYKKRLDQMCEESERWSRKMTSLVLILAGILVAIMWVLGCIYGSNETLRIVFICVGVLVLVAGCVLNMWADKERDPYLNPVAHCLILCGMMIANGAAAFIR